MFRKYQLVPVSSGLPTNPDSSGANLATDASKLPTQPVSFSNPEPARTPAPTVLDVLDAVKPSLRPRAKAILQYLMGNFRLNPENLRIVYSDDVEGSPLPKLLEWLFEGDSSEKPWDGTRFVHLLERLRVPAHFLPTKPVALSSVWKKLY